MKEKPLTLQELKEMTGKPVWCPEIEAYGIVKCDRLGRWAGIPFLHGTKHDENGITRHFGYNIAVRNLKCYKIAGVE